MPSKLTTAAKEYNAAVRRAARLEADTILTIQTAGDAERSATASDAAAAAAYNTAVLEWQQRVEAQLRARVGLRAPRVAAGLRSTSRRDKLGLVNKVGFSFPRHGIYLHYGAGRGQGGLVGSTWVKTKTVGGVEISTGIVRHTNPQSLGKANTLNRHAYDWYDSVVKQNIDELANIVAQYLSEAVVDTSRIFIEKGVRIGSP